MAFQFSTTLRNNRIGQLQSTVGSSGTMKLFSGAEPVNCAAADPSGLLCTITLPATFLTSTSESMRGTVIRVNALNHTAQTYICTILTEEPHGLAV